MKKGNIHDIIQHDGIVQKVGNDSVVVTISASSACAGCHAEGLCNMTGKAEKIIDVQGKYKVAPGDTVTVLMQQSMGYKAIALSYLAPVVIVIISLVVMASLDIPELTAGLISIGILIPYFLVLFLLRRRIDRIFTFTLKT
jgi:sigma-E factor negative regulatory protein RseC